MAENGVGNSVAALFDLCCFISTEYEVIPRRGDPNQDIFYDFVRFVLLVFFVFVQTTIRICSVASNAFSTITLFSRVGQFGVHVQGQCCSSTALAHNILPPGIRDGRGGLDGLGGSGVKNVGSDPTFHA